jgi:competence protein ComEA
MLELFRLRHSEQRTIAVVLASFALLLCGHAAVRTQETFDPKLYAFVIDMNTATHGELQTLPGIGPTLADNIIQYRDQHVPMNDFDEIRNVHGIGPKRHDAMRPYFIH